MEALVGYANHCRADNDDVRDLLLAGRVDDTGNSILNAIHQNTASVIAAGQAATLSTINSTERNGSDTRASVERNGSLNLTSTERNAGESRLLTSTTAAEGQMTTERNSAETRLLINSTSTTNLLAIKENLLELEKAACRLERQAADNTATLRLEACKNTDEIMRKVLETSATTQLEAAKIAATQAAMMAECCCELKELAKDEANRSRELMRELDANRTRDALADAKQENMLLRLSGCTPNVR